MRSRLIATLGMVLMAIVWVSPTSLAYLCSMDGQLHAACCCTPDGEQAESADTEVQREECCQVQRAATHAPPAVAAPDDDERRVVARLAWSDAEAGALPSATDLVPKLARGPPSAIGPPAYLRHCRFLI
jgi:hypothetical protein